MIDNQDKEKTDGGNEAEKSSDAKVKKEDQAKGASSQQAKEKPTAEQETGANTDSVQAAKGQPQNLPDSLAGSGLDLSELAAAITQARVEISQFLIGQQEMINLMMIGVLSDGHVLLEGVPGIAKTLTAKLMSKTLNVDFSRIQFTPDLMPSDVIGTSVYNLQKSEFEFKKGPVFSNIILIDEINRAPAKTQAALFEVMEERQITFDGQTHTMDFPFLVIATQNPVEQEGTYRLPEAQLDRFLFKIKLNYPTVSEEEQILKRYKSNIKAPDLSAIKPVFTRDEIRSFQDLIKQVKVEDQLLKYIAQITDQTRTHGKLFLGASPRASIAMLKSAKAYAAINQRDFITPDDVQYVSRHVLNHRIILSPEAEMEGLTVEDIIDEIIHKVEVPR